MSKTTSANGLSGLLMFTGDDYYFRVHSAPGIFKDYLIRHTDLAVTITDPDAFVYERPQNPWWAGVIDHSPETLGIKND